MSELSGQPPNDPEAQAAINDFSDYTEFFPSDLTRSVTLIGKLDRAYQADTDNVHKLLKLYSRLPKIPRAERQDPQALREDVSSSLDHALRSREGAYAEASRLCNVADSLYTRLSGIRAKLDAMPKPPSRDPSPVPAPRSPTANRSRRTDVERTPRLKLHMEVEKGFGSGRKTGPTIQKNKTRRIIVPGEIMPPFDPDSPGASIASDSEPERALSPVRAPVTIRPKSPSREKSAPLKIPKLKLVANPPKPQKVRPPGVMGTNVHSTVAGISVSNAMATLTPPPPDPQPGSQWAPWRELTQWEIYAIRRKMKKNANWAPSDVMVTRELAVNGRGMDNYRKAKAEAASRGEPVLDEPAHEPSGEKKQLLADIAAMDLPNNVDGSTDDEDEDEDEDKKVDEKEKLRLQEQLQMEQASKIINMHHSRVEGLLGPGPPITPTLNGHLLSPKVPPESVKRSHKKRKRDPPKTPNDVKPATASLANGLEAQSTAGYQQAVDPAPATVDDGPVSSEIPVDQTPSVPDADAMIVDDDVLHVPEDAIDPAMITSEHAPVINPVLVVIDNTVPVHGLIVPQDQNIAAADVEPPPPKKVKLVPPTSQPSIETAEEVYPALPEPAYSATVASIADKELLSKSTVEPPSQQPTRATRGSVRNAAPSNDMPPPPTPATATAKAVTTQASDVEKASVLPVTKGRKNPSLSIKLPPTFTQPTEPVPSEFSTRRNAARNAASASIPSSAASSTATVGKKDSLPPTPVSTTAASRRGTRSSDASNTNVSAPPSSIRAKRAVSTAAPTPTVTARHRSRRNNSAPSNTNANAKTTITLKGPRPKVQLKTNKNKGNQTPRTPMTANGLAAEMEAGPNEPRYCSCGAPDYGEMVACDKSGCEIDWYHVECVGLTIKPSRRDMWYCPGCRIGVDGADEQGFIR